jgi:hypothetical protein
MSTGLLAPVATAIEELRFCFADSELTIESDGTGGARVAIETVPLTSIYQQRESWIAGHLVPQLPYADIYPLFVRGDLARVDGRPLGTGLSSGQMFLGRAAVQASRRSNRRDPAIETVCHKFIKVLEWIKQHPGT